VPNDQPDAAVVGAAFLVSGAMTKVDRTSGDIIEPNTANADMLADRQRMLIDYVQTR
jgi:hypothetical protein